MAEYRKEKAEVERFLDNVKQLIKLGNNIQINCLPWRGNRVNKTLTYMAETGITQTDIEKVICDLQVCNYSYTADERNMNFRDEQVWIFGITKNVIDTDEDLYIKLKIRIMGEETLVILSFHPEEPGCEEQRLKFPYKE